ncbi:hypothetical protein [Trinickia diaoshuihuensis]|uniref:hypothetical protein n=1 Tax=Trinickia diaoshuihuensis TaxID=2292265 RepID=UPI000E246894|nr:hypothetical protein [Trinickia diaoshuihuensis]
MRTLISDVSMVARRVCAIREGRDDRLLVLCGIAAPWALPLAAGTWLRALRSEYEDELELVPFLHGTRGENGTGPLPADTAIDAMLRRLVRLRMPPAVIVESSATAYGRWRAQLAPLAMDRWTLCEHDSEHSAPDALRPNASGLLMRWPAAGVVPAGSDCLDRETVLEVSGPYAHVGASIAPLAEAFVGGEIDIAGIAFDAMLGGAAAPSHTDLANALDRLANGVRARRIASFTRRAPSLRTRL